MGKRYITREISKDTIKDYQYVLNHSDDVWIFHNVETFKYFKKRYNAKNLTFIVYNNSGLPLCALPLFLHSNKNLTFLESFEQSGPVIIKSFSEKKRRGVLHFLNNFLIELSNKNKVDVSIISSSHFSDRNINIGYSYVNPLLEMRDFSDKPFPYYYMNLSLTEKDILSKMEPERRRIIKNFELRNIKTFKIRKAISTDIVHIYSIYLDHQNRTQMASYTKEELLYLLKFKYCNFYIGFFNEIPICTICLCNFKNTGMYWLSFTSSGYIKTNIATYLLWYGIKDIKNNGIIHFDCGIDYFSDIDDKLELISKFKRSFGGELRYKYKSIYNIPYKRRESPF